MLFGDDNDDTSLTSRVRTAPLYKVVVGVLAFDGSSHRLGWPLLLYGKRPRASLNCIPVDDCAVVINRGCDVHPSYAEQDRGEDCPRTKK